MEPLYKGHIGTLETVPYIRVSFIRGSTALICLYSMQRFEEAFNFVLPRQSESPCIQ